MQIPQESSSSTAKENSSAVATDEQKMRAIAYSLDALIPGLYIWCGPLGKNTTVGAAYLKKIIQALFTARLV